MFTRKDLIKLIVPLIIEQILAVTVGLVDMVMVAGAGEAAVSGVSLVDMINLLIIYILTALATGGAVVSAQFIGNKNIKKACVAANQLLLSTVVISLVLMTIAVIGNEKILKLIYSGMAPDIMNNAKIYFSIIAYSFPFLAIYNSCAALYRSMGNSKISMFVSLGMNLIHIAGNAIFIYGFHFYVNGVATSSLIARMLAAFVMLYLIRSPKNLIHVDPKLRLGFHPDIIKKILHIGIPNGLENCIFQLGKIIVAGMIVSFGTSAVTSNAVAMTITNFEIIPGMAIGLAMITVVGQCIGARDYDAVMLYTKKLMKTTYVALIIVNCLIAGFSPWIVGIYHLPEITSKVAVQLILYHSCCCITIWPLAFVLPNALRASNDVKFTMYISVASMWIWRIAFSYVLGVWFHMGLLGIWVAMTIDWLCRAICFVIRFIKGRWKVLGTVT